MKYNFLEKRNVIGIVLAAGYSTRLGTPKQCIVLPNGLTLLHNACLLLANCNVPTIRVALGGNSGLIIEKNDFLKKNKLKSSCLQIVDVASNLPGMTSTLKHCLETQTIFDNHHYFTILCDNPGLSAQFLKSFANYYFNKYSKQKLILRTLIQNKTELFAQPPMLFDACFANMLVNDLQGASHDKLVLFQDRLKPWIDTCAAKHNYSLNTISFPTSHFWHDIDTPTDVSTALDSL